MQGYALKRLVVAKNREQAAKELDSAIECLKNAATILAASGDREDKVHAERAWREHDNLRSLKRLLFL